MKSVPFLGSQNYSPTKVQVNSAKDFVNEVSHSEPLIVEKILLVALPILMLIVPIAFGPAILSSSTSFLSKISLSFFCLALSYPGIYLHREISKSHERFKVIKKLYPLFRKDIAQDSMLFRKFHPINRLSK